MILAIIGEELGLVGILGVIALYGMIAYAGLRAAKLARDLLLEAARRRGHLADPVPGDAQLLRGDGHGAAHRRAAAVPLLRELEPDRADGRDGAAAERGRHRRPRRAGPNGQDAAWRRSREDAMPTIVIAAGGTAGHVVPALAVADALRDRGAQSSSSAASAPRRSSCRRPATRSTAICVRGLDRRNPLRGAARAAGRRRAGRARRCCARSAPTRCSAAAATWPARWGWPRAAAAAARPHRGRQPPGGDQPAAGPLAARVFLAFPIEGRGAQVPRDGPAGAARHRAPTGRGRARFGIARATRCLLVFGGSLGARRLNDGGARRVRHGGALLGPARERAARPRRAAPPPRRARARRTTSCIPTSSRSPTRWPPPTWPSRAPAASVLELAAAGCPPCSCRIRTRPPTTRPRTPAGWTRPARPWWCRTPSSTGPASRVRRAALLGARSGWRRWRRRRG